MEEKKIPPPLLSAVPVVVLIMLLFLAVRSFGSDTLEGASQIVLLTATAVCAFIAIVFCGTRWHDIEQGIVNNITGVASVLFLLLLIGAVAGSWMISGIIPSLIYYGMKIIHPDFYLASACFICAVVSIMTGSSWTTIATIGIALSGIGMAQGFSPGWIGGAIISGAYFGDKISPLSDTTILASAVTNTPLFVHIRYMMITTIPSITIAMLIYIIAGLSKHTASPEETALFSAALKSKFYITPWLFSVPILMFVMIVKKVPALITLFVSTLLACVCALIFQQPVLREIAEGGDSMTMFRGIMITIFGQTHIDTGNELLNNLVSTRGMSGMMNTVWLIMCAMAFGGAMTASGMLKSIVTIFMRFMKRRVGMIASTVFSGLIFNICTGDQYLSIILTGDIFKDIYKNKGYESRLLSRTTEDAVTVTSPLVPWNTCGMTQATVLGISTLTYLPYSFFNMISPLMSIFIAATGYKIKRYLSPNPSPL